MKSTLRWSVWLLSAEALAMAGVTALTVVKAIEDSGQSTLSRVATPILALLAVAILGGLAFALHRRIAPARSPAVVLQLLLVPIGWQMIVGGLPWPGVASIVAGIAGVILLLHPSTRSGLGIE